MEKGSYKIKKYSFMHAKEASLHNYVNIEPGTMNREVQLSLKIDRNWNKIGWGRNKVCQSWLFGDKDDIGPNLLELKIILLCMQHIHHSLILI